MHFLAIMDLFNVELMSLIGVRTQKQGCSVEFRVMFGSGLTTDWELIGMVKLLSISCL